MVPITNSLKDFSTSKDDTPSNPFGIPGSHMSQMPLQAAIMSAGGAQTPPDLNDFDELVNYNDRFIHADPALFREGVIRETIGALIGQKKPNAMLIGPAGCGKTAVVEELARMIANHDPMIPDALADAVVYELDLSSLVSHGGIVGMLENRMDELFAALTAADHPCIVFIDEIHRLVKGTSGGGNPYRTISQALKPALARNDFMTIGATTTQEAKSLMRDPAFARRFTRVIVEELTCEQTAVVLESIWPSMSRHYNDDIRLVSHDFVNIAHIADELSPASQHRPDNAITLLDRSCADGIIRRQCAIAEATDPQLATQLKATPILLSSENVRRVAMRNATGHAMPDKLNRDDLTSALSRIIGQDRPLDVIVHALRKRDLHLFDNNRPLSLLFAGPSGVGKSEVARIISNVLFHEKPITLNMTEFSSSTALSRIVGSPQGYVGSDWDNELPFDCLETNPYRLILLDEFEKAHRSVQRLFMSALEDGYIKTNLGATISFNHAIIIATTNAGHTTDASRPIGFTSNTDSNPDKLMAVQLKSWFDSELLNRFSVMTTFNTIEKDTYATILAQEWAREIARLKASDDTLPLPDAIDDDTLRRLVDDSYAPEFGARPAHRAVASEVERILLTD